MLDQFGIDKVVMFDQLGIDKVVMLAQLGLVRPVVVCSLTEQGKSGPSFLCVATPRTVPPPATTPGSRDRDTPLGFY